MNLKSGQNAIQKSKKRTAAMAAALLMTVWGGTADAAEILTKVTKVGDAGKVELQLPENAIAMVGDKVRIEALKSGEDADPIKTRWTIKAINGNVIQASPDGEPTREPEVGFQAVINTILVQPTSADEQPADAKIADAAAEEATATADEDTAVEDKVAASDSPAEATQAETMKEPEPSAKLEETAEEKPELRPALPSVVEPEKMEQAAVGEKPDDDLEASKPEETKPEESASEDMKSEDMKSEGMSSEQMESGAPEASPKPTPEPSQEPTLKSLETVESVAEEVKETVSSSAAASEMAKDEPAQAEPEPVKDPAAVTECDTLAAHAFDPEAVSKGVEYEQLDAEAVIAACEQAVADLPNVSRFYTQLTRGLHKAGRYEEAFEATQKGAELGSAHSMAFLGVMYSQGKTVATDDAKSLEWFEKAAEKGNPGGMIFAAAMYRDGKGTVRNYQRSAELYKMAADLEVAEAMTSLAIFYDRGLGVDKNVDQATSLLLRAYRLKDREARKLLFEAPGAISMDMRKEIQVRLKADGFYSSAIDGEFGPGTRDALIKFSRAQ